MPDGASRDPTHRYHLLDGMRGLAAIMVATMHFTSANDDPLLPRATLAVDFFFVLSGFVIARAYGARLAAGYSVCRFAELRLLRLYPLYLVGILLGCVDLAISGPQTPLQLTALTLANASFLPAPLPHITHIFWIQLNAPAWSLIMEIAANLVFAMWLVRWRSDVLAAFALLVGAICLRGILKYGSGDIGSIWVMSHYGFARSLFGVTVGLLIHRGTISAPRETPLALLLPIVLLVLLATPLPIERRLIDAASMFVLLPSLVWLGTRWECPTALTRPCGLLGDISYPLYCIHHPLIRAGSILTALLPLGLGVRATLFVAATMILSALLGHFYDKPLRLRIGRWLHLRRSAMPQEL